MTSSHNNTWHSPTNYGFAFLTKKGASGHDDLPADLLKSTADLIETSIVAILNDALEHHEPLDMDKGVLILLQKPGKPVGPLTSVRPNVLLSALWKTLSLIVLSRIPTRVDNFLSRSQSEPDLYKTLAGI